jgi:hypothetical protein
VLDHLIRPLGDQHFHVGLEKLLDAAPGVGDDAGARPRCLEDARGGRKADGSHAVTGHVQHGQRGTVEGVVLSGRDVPEHPDVRATRLLRPAATAEKKPALRQAPGRLEEELLDARLPIRQAVGE